MLRFREPVYFGESLEKSKTGQKLQKQLHTGQLVKNSVTLILYAMNGCDLFDLLPANELKYPWRKDQDFYVLGLASDKSEAIELVQEMVVEVFEHTGGFDVRGYFGYQ